MSPAFHNPELEAMPREKTAPASGKAPSRHRRLCVRRQHCDPRKARRGRLRQRQRGLPRHSRAPAHDGQGGPAHPLPAGDGVRGPGRGGRDAHVLRLHGHAHRACPTRPPTWRSGASAWRAATAWRAPSPATRCRSRPPSGCSTAGSGSTTARARWGCSSCPPARATRRARSSWRRISGPASSRRVVSYGIRVMEVLEEQKASLPDLKHRHLRRRDRSPTR